MSKLTLLAASVALTALSVTAQNVTIPSAALGPYAGTSGNYFTAGGVNRFQMVYDASNFTAQNLFAPISITRVQFLFGGTTANIVTFPSVSVYLQPAAVDFAVQSTTFALNRTIDPLPAANFAGSVTTVAGTYYVDIPLTTPFSYDPSAGVDLLLEVEVNGAPTPALGNTQATTFTATPPGNACNVKRSVGSITNPTGANSAFVPIVNFDYVPDPNAASFLPLGSGCINRFSSFYELFAGPANFDLANSAVSFIPVGNGYIVVQSGSFLPVGATQTPATALALGDDAEVAQALTVGSFAGPNGPWTTLNISSNGVISELAAHPSSVGGGGAPNNNTYLNAAPTAFYHLADWDPSTATGGGNVWYEESASAIVVTWENVPNWVATLPAPGVNTFQFQLYPNGTVTIAWNAAGLTSFGNNGGVLVGYSPGGVNLDPGSYDISSIGSLGSVVLLGADVPGMSLTSNNRPVFGATWSLTAGNFDPSSTLGVSIFGLSDPGINDLFFLGMPGCGLRASLDVVNAFLVTGPTESYSLTIPIGQPALQGFNLYTTTATMQMTPLNAFGWMTSNGIRGTLGSI